MRELELWKKISSLEQDRCPLILATVIAVRGSTSARVGSKALISAEGKNLWGWVGGGCAEAFVINESLQALEMQKPRIITADLDDEVFGLGVPCGGTMDIFLEPKLPPEKLELSISNSVPLQKLLEHFGWEAARYGNHQTNNIEDILVDLACAVANSRGLKYQSIAESLGMQNAFKPLNTKPTEFLLLGHSRITEELAKLGALLGWPTRVYGLNMDPAQYPSTAKCELAQPEYAGLNCLENSYVVVASHHRGDPEFITSALKAGAAYIGMVASEKRARLVREGLSRSNQLSVSLEKLRSPAGIQLRCKNPSEIALSIVAELLP